MVGFFFSVTAEQARAVYSVPCAAPRHDGLIKRRALHIPVLSVIILFYFFFPFHRICPRFHARAQYVSAMRAARCLLLWAAVSVTGKNRAEKNKRTKSRTYCI